LNLFSILALVLGNFFQNLRLAFAREYKRVRILDFPPGAIPLDFNLIASELFLGL